MLKLAYDTWKSKQLNLSIDDILDTLGISHREFRASLQEEELYNLTPGLSLEIYLDAVSGRTVESIAKVFRVSRSQATRAAYAPTLAEKTDTLASIKKDLQSGNLTQQTIADKYGLTQARVSQYNTLFGLARTRRARKKLTPDEIASIKELSLREAMEQFNISKTTYYKVIKQ